MNLKERRKTMRGYRWECGGRTVNITNVHTHVHVYGHHENHHGNRHGGGWKKRERKPRLLRFCASGGLLDQNVVSRMSSERLMAESADVIGYAADGMCKSACNMARGVGGIIDGAFQAICLIGGAILK